MIDNFLRESAVSDEGWSTFDASLMDVATHEDWTKFSTDAIATEALRDLYQDIREDVWAAKDMLTRISCPALPAARRIQLAQQPLAALRQSRAGLEDMKACLARTPGG